MNGVTLGGRVHRILAFAPLPLVLTAVALGGTTARAQPGPSTSNDAVLNALPRVSYPSSPPPRPLPSEVLRVNATAAGTPEARPILPVPPKIKATYDGVASPGLRVQLKGTVAQGGGLTFHWIQTDGPRVVLE